MSTTPSPEEIQKIVLENEITIPASLLYTFLQYTEIGVQRGAIRANELTMIGGNYEKGTKMLNELINQKWKPKKKKKQEHKKTNIDE